MPELQYINIRQIHPHPDNPRRDVGDVTELADSIRANGILQNLTVVPNMFTDGVSGEIYQRGYLVIIGHRRLAAAKQAGLEEVPCVVREMSRRDQIKTMLMENVQRCDLTLYEQAQGFQMMLDMGETVESIAKDSGFSQSSVRRRVKLLDLDRDGFRRAETRGATLTDYMELDKIQDIELKNRVLDTIGTANFRGELKKAIDNENDKRYIADCLEKIKQWATEIDDAPHDKYTYVKNYGKWNKAAGIEPPDDADSVNYYYKLGASEIDIYTDKVEHQENDEERERKARHDSNERRNAELREISERHFRLRQEFVAGFGSAKKYAAEIMRFAAKTLLNHGEMWHEVDHELLANVLEFDAFDTKDNANNKIANALQECPEYALMAVAYADTDSDKKTYWCTEWDRNNGVFAARYKPNDDLDILYEFLKSIGYEMSDEEKAMQTAAHPLLQDENDSGERGKAADHGT